MLKNANCNRNYTNCFLKLEDKTMRRKTMLFAIIASAGLLMFAAPSFATSGSAPHSKSHDSIWIGSYGRLHNWRAVSRDELILWASPSRPYLVKIWRPFTSLKFAHTIGVTSTIGRIDKFERVIVDGQRLPIKSIVALDRESAKAMRWNKNGSGFSQDKP